MSTRCGVPTAAAIHLGISSAAVSGNSIALESLETTFHQDLNGDGAIGLVTTVIESFGSTSLVKVGNNYYLESISSGTGPELKYGGAAVVAGQFGSWAPIGAEQTASGYDVAWKNPGADQYTVWSTDSSGNYHLTYSSASVGKQRRAGIAGDHVPPGPQRRRHDRSCSRR